MTVLSLCMIVRDEEDLLPACLGSVRGVVDEMIVVDTGSRDQTVKLALAAGAKVVNFPWCDDFSAARNAALEASSGSWILVLDADERLAPGAGLKIKDALENPDLDCGFLPLSNASGLTASVAEVLSGKARKGKPVLHARLLRRTPELRWRGIIHESVYDWLKDRRDRTAEIDAPIIHYGYAPEIWNSRDKAGRNLRLLEKRCSDEPENPIYWGNLAKRQLGIHAYEKAAQSADSGWRAVETLVAAGERLPPILHLATIRIRLLLLQGKTRDALACIDQVECWCPCNPNTDFLRGHALYRLSVNTGNSMERSESLKQALISVNKCLDALGGENSSTIPGAQEFAVTACEAKSWGALIKTLIGECASALEDFKSVLNKEPQNIHAQLGYAEALILSGKSTDALAKLEPLLHIATADAHVLAAMACKGLGDSERMQEFMRTAGERMKHGFISPHRAAHIKNDPVCGS